MELYLGLLQLSLMHILMAMVPGPNTMVVSYHAASASRRAGLEAVLGIALGSTIWVTLSLAGVGIVLLDAGLLYRALRLLGAAYLFYVGLRLLRAGRTDKPALQAAPGGRSPVLAGLLTTLSNPKSAVFWTSAFVVLVPAHAPFWFYGAVVLIIAVQSSLWYGIVALMLSTPFARQHYARFAGWLDRVAGMVMIGFGLKLANDLRKELGR